MSATAISSPFPTFFGLDGKPLNNGYLFFGTKNLDPETNKVQVYWDIAGTQPAAQPIRTKNGIPYNGTAPAVIYAPNDVSIKVKSSTGSLVLYAGSIVALSLSAALADPSLAANNAGMVAFNDTLTYASSTVGSALQARNAISVANYAALLAFDRVNNPSVSTIITRGYYSPGDGGGGVYYYDTGSGSWKLTAGPWNIKQFGAVGVYPSDDTTAIQNAINALPAAGGTLIVPAGGYLISASLLFNKPVIFRGESAENTTNTRLFKKSTMTTGMIIVSSSHCSLVDLALTGQPGNAGDGLVIHNQYWKVENVTINAMGRHGLVIGDDAVATNCNIGKIDTVQSLSNGGNGIHYDSLITDAGGTTLINVNSGLNAGHGFYFNRAQLNTLIGCVAEGNTGNGLKLDSGARDIWWFGGDLEANTAGNYSKDVGALRCNVMCSSVHDAIGARVKVTGTPSTTTAVAAAVAFDGEDWDTDAMHSTSVNNSRLVATTAGKYSIKSSLEWVANATGVRKVLVKFNGTTYIAGSSTNALAGSENTFVNVDTEYVLAVGDYVEIFAYQTSGGNLNLNSAWCSISRIH